MQLPWVHVHCCKPSPYTLYSDFSRTCLSPHLSNSITPPDWRMVFELRPISRNRISATRSLVLVLMHPLPQTWRKSLSIACACACREAPPSLKRPCVVNKLVWQQCVVAASLPWPCELLNVLNVRGIDERVVPKLPELATDLLNSSLSNAMP